MSTSTSSSVSSQLYSGSASLGRGMATIGMYVMGFIGILMVIFGIILAFQKPKIDPVTGNKIYYRTSGIGLTIVGFIFIIFGYLNNILVKKYKFLAAGEGVNTVFNLFRR